MPTQYESLRGRLFHAGNRFSCPHCECDEFKVEIGSDPIRFWCDCGEMYTEQIVAEFQKVVDGGI